MSTMTNSISLAGLKAVNESSAVAAGKAVLGAIESGPVSIEGVPLDEAEWSELVAYLGRRGVRVRDNVATKAVR